MDGISMSTVVLIGVFLLISWMVRLVVFKDISRKHKEDD